MIPDAVLSRIKEVKENKPIVVIGIDGMTGSGKSFYAQKLKKALHDVLVVRTDSYIKFTRDEWLIKSKESQLSVRDLYDFSRLADVISKLKQQQDLDIKGLYNLADGTLTKKRFLPGSTAKFIIIEGLFSLDKELHDHLDLKIFLETDQNKAIERAYQRDLSERSTTKEEWKSKQDVLMKGYKPYLEQHKQSADLIIKVA